ncbi:unnamed protein product [Prorocentrum cordatum]|uniref:Secreted protein n=1 Tax=Prorocentrum cordatum TaxID=2364126 RepID=A0ABN9PUX6_9DINO|nr:unnamed protein product [Polarella glacialis]
MAASAAAAAAAAAAMPEAMAAAAVSAAAAAAAAPHRPLSPGLPLPGRSPSPPGSILLPVGGPGAGRPPDGSPRIQAARWAAGAHSAPRPLAPAARHRLLP